jgi:hypothetical protein
VVYCYYYLGIALVALGALVSVSPVNETTAGTSSSLRAVVDRFFGVISAEVAARYAIKRLS